MKSNLHIFGGITEAVAMDKALAQAEGKLPIRAGYQKKSVVIAWPGVEVDGQEGVMEGEVNGDAMVRLNFSGGVFQIPGQYLVVLGDFKDPAPTVKANVANDPGEDVLGCTVRIYDNGGETADRYSIAVQNPETLEISWLGSSEDPFHPQGFGQHVGEVSEDVDSENEHLGKRIKMADVPEPVKKFIEQEAKAVAGDGEVKAAKAVKFPLEVDLDVTDAKEVQPKISKAVPGATFKTQDLGNHDSLIVTVHSEEELQSLKKFLVPNGWDVEDYPELGASLKATRISAAPEKTKEKEKGAPTATAPAPPNAPRSTGTAPQETELTDRAKENRTILTEKPSSVGDTKPQAISLDLAKAAPEGGSAVQKALSEVEKLDGLRAKAEAEVEDLMEKLKVEVIAEKYTKAVEKLAEEIKKTGQPVVRIKESFLAVTKEREVVEANMSEETAIKYRKLMAELAASKTKMVDVNKQIKDLVNTSFASMGGTEKSKEKVTKFEGTMISVVSAMEKSEGLADSQVQAINRLTAGLLDMFRSAYEAVKDFLGTFKSLESAASDFAKAYAKDAKKEPKAEAASAKA